MLWQQLFAVVQMLDPVYAGPNRPIWPITDEEAKMLATSTSDYLKTLPKNKKGTLQKFIDKHMPLIAFTATIGIVVKPRIDFSWEVHRRGGQLGAFRFGRDAAAQHATTYNRTVSRDAAAGDGGPAGFDAEVDAAFADANHVA
jgi:hypothetical protein